MVPLLADIERQTIIPEWNFVCTLLQLFEEIIQTAYQFNSNLLNLSTSSTKMIHFFRICAYTHIFKFENICMNYSFLLLFVYFSFSGT